jgi:hypothetical protein
MKYRVPDPVWSFSRAVLSREHLLTAAGSRLRRSLDHQMHSALRDMNPDRFPAGITTNWIEQEACELLCSQVPSSHTTVRTGPYTAVSRRFLLCLSSEQRLLSWTVQQLFRENTSGASAIFYPP